MQASRPEHPNFDAEGPSAFLPLVDRMRPPQLNPTICGCRCGCPCSEGHGNGNGKSNQLGQPILPNVVDRDHKNDRILPTVVTENDPMDTDEGSDIASVIGQEGLEYHHFEYEAREVGDSGAHTPGSIQRSIARRQDNCCDCPELTNGRSASSTSVEPNSGTQSMSSSGFLPHVLSSSILLGQMGAMFDDIGEIDMPPPTMAQQLHVSPQNGSEVDLSMLQSFSEYDMW